MLRLTSATVSSTLEISQVSLDDCFAALCLVPSGFAYAPPQRTTLLYQKPPRMGAAVLDEGIQKSDQDLQRLQILIGAITQQSLPPHRLKVAENPFRVTAIVHDRVDAHDFILDVVVDRIGKVRHKHPVETIMPLMDACVNRQ